LYHYGGNNPVRYIDPDGRAIATISLLTAATIATVKAFLAWAGSLFVAGVTATAIGISIDNVIDNNFKESSSTPLIEGVAPGVNAIPEEDKDKIAEHAHDGGHGHEVNLDDPSKQGIKDKIDDVLTNPETQVGVRKRDNTTGYLAPDGTLVIHNPAVEDKGTVFTPDNPQEYFDRNFK